MDLPVRNVLLAPFQCIEDFTGVTSKLSSLRQWYCPSKVSCSPQWIHLFVRLLDLEHPCVILTALFKELFRVETRTGVLHEWQARNLLLVYIPIPTMPFEFMNPSESGNRNFYSDCPSPLLSLMNKNIS